MKRYDWILLTIFTLSIPFIVCFLIPSLALQNNGFWQYVLLPAIAGYFSAYLFYLITVFFPKLKNENYLKKETNAFYSMLIRRLYDTFAQAEMQFNFAEVVNNEYLDGFYEAFEISNIGEKAIKLFFNNISTENFEFIYYHNCPNSQDLTLSLIDYYKSEEIKNHFKDMQNFIIPQLLLIEKRSEFRLKLINLSQNISDTFVKIKSEEENCDLDVVFPHFINLLAHFKEIYMLLNKQFTKIKNTYNN